MSDIEADLQVLQRMAQVVRASDASLVEKQSNPSHPAPSDALADEVDLQKLAEKVFMLLKRELRIERERLGRRR